MSKAIATKAVSAAPAVKAERKVATPRKSAAKKETAPAAPTPAAPKSDPMAAMLQQADIANAIKAADAKANEELKAENKAKRETRPAQGEKKTTEKKSAMVAVATLAVKFVIAESGRAKAGRHMNGHTQAVIELLKLDKQGAPRDLLQKIIGNTAVAYHIKQDNFEMTPGGVKLTVKGINHFGKRVADKQVDPQDVDAYKSILTTGQIDGRLLKNAIFVSKLA